MSLVNRRGGQELLYAFEALFTCRIPFEVSGFLHEL